ncbi:MAG TPA: FtsX-like permease family protein, partial [Solirubrobacterales bacterium]|nr:FtsX-like permease family protein [Solirubrobacterales bacterium]
AGAQAGLMGGGAVAIVLAVSLFSSYLIRPLATLAGAPLQRIGGMPGRLARENTHRKPGRTAVTAAALMIGIAVVTFFSVFGAGFKATIDDAVDESFQGELVLTTNGFTTISPRAAEAAGEVDGVRTVAALRFSQAEVEGAGRQSFTGLEPEKAAEVLSLDWVEGTEATLADLSDEQAVVAESFADANEISVGDRLEVLTQLGERPSFEVVGVIAENAGLFGAALINQDVITERFGADRDMIDFIKLEEGASGDEVQAALAEELDRAFPTVEVLNQTELKDQQSAAIDQLLLLVYVLVALAIIVSLFGIANTLALSIHERTREIGMLRGIGMTRRQVRRMIRYEAVITALIGAILGMVLGMIFAALISIPLAEEGFTLSYPVGALFAILVVSGAAGVLAAIPPARRASRLDILRAIGHE